MSDPTSDDDLPLDRWSIPLDESTNSPPAPPPPALVGGQPPPNPPVADEPVPDFLRFPLTDDVPGEDFQPQLRRFDKAG